MQIIAENEAKMNESMENLVRTKEVIQVLNEELFALRM